MNRTVKRILKILSLFAAVGAVLLYMQSYIMRPWDFNHIRTKGFYMEPKDSIDMVLLGQSDIVRAYSPLKAYENTGYTSYVLACDGITAAMWKPLTESAMQYQNPDYFIIDVNNVCYGEDTDLHRPFDQQMTDDMPYDTHRFSIAMDAKKTGSDRWLSYLLPIQEYHVGFPANWADVPDQLHEIRTLEKRGYTYFKGDAQTYAAEKPGKVLNLKEHMEKQPLSARYEKVLNDYLDFADEHHLNVVFIQTPHRIPGESSKLFTTFKRSLAAQEIIEERGYPFLNTELLKDEIGLDMEVDFYNNGHLNYPGQVKFTDWLWKTIEEQKLLPLKAPDHPEHVKEEWDTCLKYYHAYAEYLPEFKGKKNTEMCMETTKLIEKLEARMN